jgi:hypothetical protein
LNILYRRICFVKRENFSKQILAPPENMVNEKSRCFSYTQSSTKQGFAANIAFLRGIWSETVTRDFYPVNLERNCHSRFLPRKPLSTSTTQDRKTNRCNGILNLALCHPHHLLGFSTVHPPLKLLQFRCLRLPLHRWQTSRWTLAPPSGGLRPLWCS